MIKLLRLLCVIAGLLALPLTEAHADTQDVAAAARGVVRVILVATDGDEAYFVGHGSGVAVAPDKILTNAHVVELTREEKSIVIGVIPSEGTKSYGGKVIAYSPGNDLALIQLRSEEHTSELQSLMRISYAVFCLKKKNNKQQNTFDIVTSD